MTAPNKGRGKAYQWICDHVGYTGDDCIRWPFSTVRGYGNLGLNGKIVKAGRLMCEMVHGKPLTPQHEAAHSCGNGKHRCMNPNHISWKTREENQQDRVRHGTAGSGMVGRCKLTLDQVNEIRALPAPVNRTAVGKKYGVDPSTIRMILRGDIWRADRKYRVTLTPQEVRAIRRFPKSATLPEISKATGIGAATIWRVRKRVAYRHV